MKPYISIKLENLKHYVPKKKKKKTLQKQEYWNVDINIGAIPTFGNKIILGRLLSR